MHISGLSEASQPIKPDVKFRYSSTHSQNGHISVLGGGLEGILVIPGIQAKVNIYQNSVKEIILATLGK